MKKIFSVVAILSLVFSPVTPVFAAADSWNVNANGNWIDATNWSGGIPGTGDTATFSFALTGGRTVTVDASRSIGIIEFGNTSISGYTLSGGSLSLDNAGIIRTLAANGDHTDKISSNIAIQGDGGAAAFTASATSASSLLSILGGVTGVSTAGHITTLTLNGINTGNNTLSGVIGDGSAGGKVAVTKSGAGTWVLSGPNTYTGATTISTGVLNIRNASALGTVAGSTTVASGAALQIQGGITTLAEGLTLDGGGISADGALRNISGDNTYAGLVALGGDTRINSDAGTLTLSNTGTISGAHALTVGGAGNTTINSILGIGAGTLTKEGAGTLVLSGANTYSGLTTVNAGTLTLSGSNSAASGGVTLTSGTLNINNANALGSGTLTINGGTIDNTSSGLITNAVANPITIGGNFAFTGTHDLNLGTGSVGLGAATRTVTTNASTLTVGGIISGGAGAGLTKAGAGYLALSGDNTYDGATTINGGRLILDFSAAGAPGADIINSASTLVMGGGMLNLTGKASTTNSQTFNDLTLNSGASSVVLAANVTPSPLLLDLGNINRNVGGTIDFNLPTDVQSGTNGITTTLANTSGNILGGWATVGGTDWATNNGTNVVAMTSYYTTATGGNTALNYAGKDVDVTSNEGEMSGALTLNSLRFNASDDYTLTLKTGTINTISSGGILVTNTVGNNLSTITGGTLRGSASGDLVVIQNNTQNGLTIASVIANNTGATGLTKSGGGTLTLSGDNSYTGNTTINEGSVVVTGTSSNVLGTGASALTMRDGTTLLLINDDEDNLTLDRNTTVSGTTDINSTRQTDGAGTTQRLGTLSMGAGTLNVGLGSSRTTAGTQGLTFLTSVTLSGDSTISVTGGYFSTALGGQLTLGTVNSDGTARAFVIENGGTETYQYKNDVTVGNIGAGSALASVNISGNDISIGSIGVGGGAAGVTGSTVITATTYLADTGSLTFSGTAYNANAQTYTAASGSNLIINGTVGLTTFTSNGADISFVGANLILSNDRNLKVDSGNGAINLVAIRGHSSEDVELDAGTGTVTVGGAIGSLDEIRQVSITGATIKLGGNIVTSNADGNTVTLTGAVVLTTGVTIDTDNAANDGAVVINGAGTVDSFDSTARAFAITACTAGDICATGTADVTIGGAMGNTNSLGAITISGNDISVANIGGAASGAAGAVTITAINASGDDALLTLTGTTYNTDSTQSYTGGADGISITGVGATFTTTADNVTFTGAVQLGNIGTLNVATSGTAAESGNIHFTSSIEGTSDEDLLLDAGSANVSIGGAIGSANQINTVAITGATITLGGNVTTSNAATNTVTLTGNVAISAGVTIDTDTATDGNVNITGTVNSSNSTDRAFTITAGTADVTVGGAIGATNDLDTLTITGNDVSVASIGGSASGVTGATIVTATDGTDNALLTLSGTTYKTAGTQAYTGGTDGISITSSSGAAFTTTADNVTFTGTTTLSNGADLSVITAGSPPASGNITMGAIRGTSSEDVTLNASSANVIVGAIGVAAANDINTVAITGAGITLNGSIITDNTSGNSVTITGATTLGGDLAINTSAGTGNINLTSTVDNATHLLTINNTGASVATIGGVMSNTGGLTKLGPGTLILNSNNTYAGPTTISGGTVQVGHVNALGTGGVTESATLNIGLIHLVVGGAYVQDASSVLVVNVDGASSGAIIATGVASTPGAYGVTVNVSTTRIASNTTYTIIDGTGGALLEIPTITVIGNNHVTFNASASNNDLILTAIRSNTYDMAPQADSNGLAAGKALEVIAAQGATGDMANVLTTLDTLSAPQLGEALDTMVPDVSSGDVQGSKMMMGQLLTSVGQRLGFWRNGFAGGLATGDMFQGAGFWMQGMGSHANQGTRQGIEGFRANTFGTSIGVDKLLGRHGRIGLAGGYSYAAVHSKTPGSPSSGINSFQTTVYGSYDSTDLELGRKAAKNGGYIRPNRQWWYADGMLAFGANGYDSRRDISLGSETRTAKADHYGQQYSAKTELGYTMTFEKTKALEITPFTSLEYTYLYMNRYTETGADSLNLNVNGQGYNTLEQGLGLKFGYPIYKENWGTFVPSIKGAWLYDYISDMFQSTSSFVGGGPSFNSSGAHPSKNGFLTGLQLAFMNIGNMTLTANYDFTLRDQFLDQTYYLTARFDF